MDQNELFTVGFNAGYLFKKSNPLLFNVIAKINEEKDEYLYGFKAGGTQFEVDRRQELLKERRTSNNLDKDQGLDHSR